MQIKKQSFDLKERHFSSYVYGVRENENSDVKIRGIDFTVIFPFNVLAAFQWYQIR